MRTSDFPTVDVPIARPADGKRGPLLVLGVLAATGGTAVYAVALPQLFLLSVGYGVGFAVLAAASIGAVVALLVRPTGRRAVLAVVPSIVVVSLWWLGFRGTLPEPDPWLAVNAELGITADVCAGLAAVAVLCLLAVAVPRRGAAGRGRRIAGWALAAPVLALVLAVAAVGVATAGNGFTRPGLLAEPGTVTRPVPGRVETVSYCAPGGAPLAMDLWAPSRSAGAAPVALYVHGGLVLGDRQVAGVGGALANTSGALFPGLQRELVRRGFLVAAVDYRLPPWTAWPAPIEDVKCAVRFLRAHAATLGVDPGRIGVWGSSAGGLLSSLLGVTGPAAGFDVGQYPGQSSAVQAVVDMFGPADLNDFGDASPFGRLVVRLGFGDSPAVRRAASPGTYVAPGAPPFLIVQGADDSTVRPRQTAALADTLRAAGNRVTYLLVHGTGHRLDAPTETPAPAAVTATVADFLTGVLR